MRQKKDKDDRQVKKIPVQILHQQREGLLAPTDSSYEVRQTVHEIGVSPKSLVIERRDK